MPASPASPVRTRSPRDTLIIPHRRTESGNLPSVMVSDTDIDAGSQMPSTNGLTIAEAFDIQRRPPGSISRVKATVESMQDASFQFPPVSSRIERTPRPPLAGEGVPVQHCLHCEFSIGTSRSCTTLLKDEINISDLYRAAPPPPGGRGPARGQHCIAFLSDFYHPHTFMHSSSNDADFTKVFTRRYSIDDIHDRSSRLLLHDCSHRHSCV